ncbi:unnamed protein product [Diatraea saccharalis]|uniref:Uncharacterized protein n=1 Tax=Diatraea saccharalis TaxID=40085 RepID=A0A9N9WH34_9NEOP|nr:unnamed protein product [Diatraea saccharalis]
MKYILVEAQPSCTFTGNNQRDIICVSGKSDYVLVRGLVSDNNKTTGVTLRNCKIIDVEFEAFERMPVLEYLDLSQNQIKYLKLGVLDGFNRLKFLNLSYNELEGFPLGLFDQKPNLEVLDLKGNSIVNLELGVFDPMKKLKHVDLSSNALLGRDMNPYIFDQSTHIKFMDFSRNDMTDSKDILLDAFEELDFLNLDRCQLNEVPKFATKSNLKTIKHLMLSTNNIRAINDSKIFMNLENLEILNLSYNIIESIAADVFTPLKKLKMIKLMNNRLTQIPDTLFRNIPNLNNVDLSHNLIEFVPVNAFRSSPIKHLNLSDNRFSYLSDNFCLELKNSGGVLAKFYFNQNPWQCACLRDILNEVKNFGIVYNNVKYTGDEPVCVTNPNGFNCMRQMQENKYYVDLYYNIYNSITSV